MTLPRFITAGIQNQIPSLTQLDLWGLYMTMQVEEKDYLQIFELKTVYQEDCFVHLVVHSQEVPEYHKELSIPAHTSLSGIVYIINDHTHLTMLWAYEY